MTFSLVARCVRPRQSFIVASPSSIAEPVVTRNITDPVLDALAGALERICSVCARQMAESIECPVDPGPAPRYCMPGDPR
jgi:hypothetical protein